MRSITLGKKVDPVLQDRIESLESQVRQLMEQQATALMLSEYLPAALVDLVGAEIESSQISGKIKVLDLGSVTISIDPFNATVVFAATDRPGVMHEVVRFASDGKLDRYAVRRVRGFLEEVKNPTVESAFWHGTVAS